jgi:hypothetical protein
MWLAAGDHSTAEHLVDGIRSVALCLEEWDRETAVEETLKASTVVLLEETKKEVKRIVEEVASEVKSSMNQTEGRAGGRNWADDVEEEFSQRNTIQDIAKAIPSYAQVLANEWRKDANKKEDRRHHDYMAKEALRRRRVLIDGLEGVQSATGDLNPKEIVEKANIALEAARVRTDGNGTELEKKPLAVAAKRLENGGVVIEMASEETAEWVRLEDVRSTFEESFRGSAKIKDQLFQVVASFLPVTIQDELELAAPRIETDNALPSDCIAKCRWLKDPKFWISGQRFAHAIITVKGRLEASLLIRHGVIIEGQRFRVRKMMEEPRRCFKCQRMGHMASGCKEIHEICPNCSGAHAGKECSKQPKKFRCINCIKAKLPAGHAVWDRDCPSMLEERKRIAE